MLLPARPRLTFFGDARRRGPIAPPALGHGRLGGVIPIPHRPRARAFLSPTQACCGTVASLPLARDGTGDATRNDSADWGRDRLHRPA